jgi:hypothetical protein
LKDSDGIIGAASDDAHSGDFVLTSHPGMVDPGLHPVLLAAVLASPLLLLVLTVIVTSYFFN